MSQEMIIQYAISAESIGWKMSVKPENKNDILVIVYVYNTW